MEIAELVEGLERLGQGGRADVPVLEAEAKAVRVRMTCYVVAPDDAPQDEPAEAPAETPDDGESQAA